MTSTRLLPPDELYARTEYVKRMRGRCGRFVRTFGKSPMNDLSESTYVRQDLSEIVRRQEQTPQGIQEVEEEVLRQFKDALEAHHQLVVVGRAGRGKTSLLYWAVQRQLDVLEKDQTTLVPVYVPFNELPVGGRPDLEAHCRGAIAGGDQRIGQWLWNHVNKGNVLLLIDALDEVPARERPARLNDSSLFAEIVREMLAPDARIVLTCRDSAYPELRDRLLELRRPGAREGFAKMELKPFTRDQIADYARKFFGDGAEADEFLKAIQDPRAPSPAGGGTARYTHLAEEPLYLHVLCWLYSSEEAAS